MIKLQGISKTFPPDLKVLEGIDLEVAASEWVWLMGEMGIGKSVLLKIIYGVEEPTEGTVRVLEEDVHELKESELARLRRRLGIVFQDIRLFEDRTAADNISMVLRALGESKLDAREKTEQWLETLGLKELAERRTFELSVGQRQKVALARALAKQPELLLLDEPFSALDEKQTRQMLKMLGKFNHKGLTIFGVSHEQEILNFLPGRILNLTSEGIS
ncbi:ATP-binding cassette domain-containing protein [candidate division WOR-3 bacterium]|nr:ATP-binding cassette domain-containing protein [candidate division WOR-3 bacterium]